MIRFNKKIKLSLWRFKIYKNYLRKFLNKFRRDMNQLKVYNSSLKKAWRKLI